jgi:hypothetical protein
MLIKKKTDKNMLNYTVHSNVISMTSVYLLKSYEVQAFPFYAVHLLSKTALDCLICLKE